MRSSAHVVLACSSRMWLGGRCFVPSRKPPGAVGSLGDASTVPVAIGSGRQNHVGSRLCALDTHCQPKSSCACRPRSPAHNALAHGRRGGGRWDGASGMPYLCRYLGRDYLPTYLLVGRIDRLHSSRQPPTRHTAETDTSLCTSPRVCACACINNSVHQYANNKSVRRLSLLVWNISQEERVGNGVARWQREWVRRGVVHLSAKQVWRRST